MKFERSLQSLPKLYIPITLNMMLLHWHTEKITEEILCKFLLRTLQYFLKLRLCENATKFLRNHHLRFVLCSATQIYSGDFANSCGLLRIYELYLWPVEKTLSKVAYFSICLAVSLLPKIAQSAQTKKCKVHLDCLKHSPLPGFESRTFRSS